MADETPIPTAQPQTIKIELVNKQEEKTPEIPRKDTGIDYKFNPEYHRFCDDLGVDRLKRDDGNLANKVSFIYDWAKDAVDSEDGVAISLAVRDLIQRLGTPVRGESLVNHLYQWTRLERDGERLRSKEMEQEMVEKQLETKQKIKAIEPKISPEELEKRVKEGMKDIQKEIKRKVKGGVTLAINKGIKEALSKAMTK